MSITSDFLLPGNEKKRFFFSILFLDSKSKLIIGIDFSGHKGAGRKEPRADSHSNLLILFSIGRPPTNLYESPYSFSFSSLEKQKLKI